jgi:hypothetical protein
VILASRSGLAEILAALVRKIQAQLVQIECRSPPTEEALLESHPAKSFAGHNLRAMFEEASSEALSALFSLVQKIGKGFFYQALLVRRQKVIGFDS